VPAGDEGSAELFREDLGSTCEGVSEILPVEDEYSHVSPRFGRVAYG